MFEVNWVDFGLRVEYMMKKQTKTATKTKKTVPRLRKSAHRFPVLEDADAADRFQHAILHWDGLARKRIENGNTIGILGEKSMHSILKAFVTTDDDSYEIPIRSIKDEASDRKFVADILENGHIYEIQTGGFYPLIPKLRYYLEHTVYDVTVIHPLPGIRYKVWIDPESGEVVERKKSTTKGRAEDALKELFWIREFLSSPRLHVKLLILEEEEYRYLDGWSKDKKRGSNRCERVPVALLGEAALDSPSDYLEFLMPELPTEFTASEFGALFGFRGKTVYSALKVFLSLGIFREIGKRGRSILYCRADFSALTEDADD